MARQLGSSGLRILRPTPAAHGQQMSTILLTMWTRDPTQIWGDCGYFFQEIQPMLPWSLDGNAFISVLGWKTATPASGDRTPGAAGSRHRGGRAGRDRMVYGVDFIIYYIRANYDGLI